MTTNALDRIGQRADSPARTAERIGQATAVEQARAVAEVQAAIVVAQQCPRDMQKARQQMTDSCKQLSFAERAFFRYSRGGSQITGPSVGMARELARCFGNVQYGLTELRRDDEHGQSEMQAWAWDVQNNTRASTTFIVPHGRDTSGGRKALTDLRDIYENNANNGARRLREQIFAILPEWFKQEAQELATAALREGGGVALPVRIDRLVDRFAELKVTQGQLEARLGKAIGQWDERDVAQLTVVGQSLARGEVNRDDEFPVERVTGKEIAAPPASAAATQPPATAPAPATEFNGTCDGTSACTASPHIHGCFADSGDCDDPGEHFR